MSTESPAHRGQTERRLEFPFLHSVRSRARALHGARALHVESTSIKRLTTGQPGPLSAWEAGVLMRKCMQRGCVRAPEKPKVSV